MVSMLMTAVRCFATRILAETLAAPAEPLSPLLEPLVHVLAADACRVAARALLDLRDETPTAPPWLAAHQARAFTRIGAIVRRYGGAVLADAVGSGKSYVALAAAQATAAPIVLVVPMMLLIQWRMLLERLSLSARVVTHEQLSYARQLPPRFRSGSFVIVDEAHHFRNPHTRRYAALARLVVRSQVLLVSATPVHNRPADLLHVLRLFLRDDALVGFGVPSLLLAARDPRVGPAVHSAVTRLVVARSRQRVTTSWDGMRFPIREAGRVLRAATATPETLATLIDGVQQLRPPGPAPLIRLTLLRRLASSVPALRQSLRRYEAFCTMAQEARLAQRRLTPRDFRRTFDMRDDADLQLVFLPLLLETVVTANDDAEDPALVRRLLDAACAGPDPKATALARSLDCRFDKTIVFVEAAATLHHLRRTLIATTGSGDLLVRGLCVGAVCGTAGWLGLHRVPRFDVLAAFAPHAQGVASPPRREEVRVLLATDLVGEGLNLHDARRVIHYDLPWSPARLAQRVGRIDRLGSTHERVESLAFLPDGVLADALDIEARLAAKVSMQISGGAAQVETPAGERGGSAPFDWCDRLQSLATGTPPRGLAGVCATVAATRDAVVLVVALGSDVEVIVVESGVTRADPNEATALLESAADLPAAADGGPTVALALQSAAPLLRARLSDIASARWRAADRDRPGRRLIPMVLAAARRAARSCRGDHLARLDALVARLTGGLTAGEALLLDDLLAADRPLDVATLLAWHDRLRPVVASGEPPVPRLVAAIGLVRGRESPS